MLWHTRIPIKRAFFTRPQTTSLCDDEAPEGRDDNEGASGASLSKYSQPAQRQPRLSRSMHKCLLVLSFLLAGHNFNWRGNSGLRQTPDRTINDSSIVTSSKILHGFEYNRDRWDQHGPPKIVILTGPHKTASTTLQQFMVDLAGQTIGDESWNRSPHPSIRNWIWPLSDPNEHHLWKARYSGPKSFAPLASLVFGRRMGHFFPRLERMTDVQEQRQYLGRVENHYRSMFRIAWEDERKNIVLGSEEFDAPMEYLLMDESSSDKEGEDVHVVSPRVDAMIDRLLDIILSHHDGADDDGNDKVNNSRPPPQLHDIEIHINHRTPRISHVTSLWHERGYKSTLRSYLAEPTKSWNLYQVNSLALALQFVRKGIKTTIVDMAGVSDHYEQYRVTVTNNNNNNNRTDESAIDGQRGVTACGIMQLGNGSCDHLGRLHLSPPLEGQSDRNRKSDSNIKDLSEEQLEAIDRVLNEYDCGVWMHLQKYQARGFLRILHPSKNLFRCCQKDDDGNGTKKIEPILTFHETVRKIRQIATVPHREDAKGASWDHTKLQLQSASSAGKEQLPGFMVLGMHRSGTSMLSGLLVKGFGYEAGDERDLISPRVSPHSFIEQ